MGVFRVWLFRGLAAAAAFLMVRSFIMPWWDCYISHEVAGHIAIIKIYSYGIRYSYGLPGTAEYLAEYGTVDETPSYQTVLAWVYLAASVGLILYSTWLKGRKGRWLLGGTGLVYIAYVAIAIIWVAIRTGDFGIPLQGWCLIIEGEGVNAIASLRLGYYLAHASGLTCIALALLRNIIVGRLKPGG